MIFFVIVVVLARLFEGNPFKEIIENYKQETLDDARATIGELLGTYVYGVSLLDPKEVQDMINVDLNLGQFNYYLDSQSIDQFVQAYMLSQKEYLKDFKSILIDYKNDKRIGHCGFIIQNCMGRRQMLITYAIPDTELKIVAESIAFVLQLNKKDNGHHQRTLFHYIEFKKTSTKLTYEGIMAGLLENFLGQFTSEQLVLMEEEAQVYLESQVRK